MDFNASLDFLTQETALALFAIAALIVGVLWAGSLGPKGEHR